MEDYDNKSSFFICDESVQVFELKMFKCTSIKANPIEGFMFGAPTSHEKIIKGLLKLKFSLYYHIDVFVEDLISLLLCWKEHERKFSNVEKLSL